jgi:hypothetical protein
MEEFGRKKNIVLFVPFGMSRYYDRTGKEIQIINGKTVLENLDLLSDYLAAGFLIDFYFDNSDLDSVVQALSILPGE